MSRPTININLEKEERKKIEKEIRKLNNRKKADRLRVVLYKDDEHSNKFIAKSLQIGRHQVTKILQRYQQEGWPALIASGNHQGSKAKLSQEQQQALKIELSINIYATAHQVIAWVDQQWEVKYEVSGMQKLLKRLGFSYKKNRLVPSKADPELQRQFVQWFAGLRKHLGPYALLLFCDAAHFKHNAEAGYGWSLKGKPHQIPSNTGRQRYNVLGAYDPQSQKYCFMLTESNINQDKIIEFLTLLRTKFPDKETIYLILDNASYNHAHRVKDAAREQKIILDYLPPYSPNLNPIERLWKFVRKKFFKDKYRATFATFCQQLDDFFANLDQYRDELASLITENFELFSGSWQTSALA